MGAVLLWVSLVCPWFAACVLDDPLSEAKRDLRSSRVEVRRAAVHSLTRVEGEEAWELLLVALEDRDSRVADVAQWHLARAEGGWCAEVLLGRDGLGARSESVRQRVAELLGRTEHDWPAAALARELRTRDAESQRLLCWSVERLAERGRIVGELDALRRAVARLWRSARDGGVRAAAFAALARLDAPDWDDYSSASLAAREPELRCAAIDALVQSDAVERSSSGAEAIWAELLDDEDPLVRTRAVRALRAVAQPAQARALVSLLESDASARVRHHVLDSLRALSGRKHRFDPRPWSAWAETLGAEWRAPDSGRRDGSGGSGDWAGSGRPVGGIDQDAPAVAGGSRVRFAELPVVSERVCFLIDFSGSMWMAAADGSVPKERVDALLREALEALPESAQFNVIPFANEPLPWREELVRATRKNVRRALDDFGRCRARGRGNFFDAFRLALTDPDVDTIVTLTDGVPTGGFHSRLELVEARVLELQRFRPVALDTVLVDCTPGVRRRWERLAAVSGGRCVEISLR